MTLDLDTLSATFRARPVDDYVNLAGYHPGDTPFIDDEDDAEDELEAEMHEQLFDAHELLFAEDERKVLLVLQGLDCSGKNGTIKHVVIAMNPAGVRTTSFGKPAGEEVEEHFLERIRRALPHAGQLGVFDRSHYEDVVVPMALGTEDEATIDRRIDEINEFEAELIRTNNTIARTTTDVAPWYVIPADHKWYRNWVIAKLLLATFDSMGAAYPQPDLYLEDLRARLAPPN